VDPLARCKACPVVPDRRIERGRHRRAAIGHPPGRGQFAARLGKRIGNAWVTGLRTSTALGSKAVSNSNSA